jgi:Flp pilus assembly protein TadB
MSGLRLMLVALLVTSTALFAAGVIAERSQTEGHAEPASVHARESGEPAAEPEGAHAEGGEAAGTGEGRPTSEHSEERETVLGVDIESTPLIVLAVIAGLALAVLVAAPPGRPPAVLLTIAAIAVAWAVLDVREAVHQIDESRSGLAALAIAVALLHLAAAAAAARLAARERDDIGSPDHAGTMPA